MGKWGEEGEYLRGESVKTDKDLEIWKKGIDLVEDIYRFTKTFPRDEMYGFDFTDETVCRLDTIKYCRRRQIVNPTRNFSNFCILRYGSLSEIETQLFIAQRLGYTLG